MKNNNQLDQLDNLLGTLFYRRSCPETETLGDYYMGLLPKGQRLVVAKHLQRCPHCSSELALYAPAEQSDESWLDNLISRVRWAFPMPDLQPAMRDRSVLYDQKTYHADDITVQLDISPAQFGYQRWDLIGELTTTEAIGRVTLWDGLDDQRAEIESSPIDQEDGYFRFQQLKTGIYYLCFSNPPTEIWLGEIEVGEIDTS